MKHYIFDVESNGLLDTLDKIHCIVIYDIQNKKTFSYRPGDIDKAITKLEEADLLIGRHLEIDPQTLIVKDDDGTLRLSFTIFIPV